MVSYIIVEDERHSALMLEALIAKLRPEWILIKVLGRVSKTVEYLKSSEQQPDLIFMDIQLKDDICFSIFEQVKVEVPIIFTTAYEHYAIRAFEVNSIDYLLKPIDELKLLRSIERYEQSRDSQSQDSQSITDGNRSHEINAIDYEAIALMVKSQEIQYRQRFIIKGIDSFTKVNAEDIAYLYIEEGTVSIVLFSGKEHVVDFSIDKIEQELDPSLFFRVNRSMIVNIDAIEQFENYIGSRLALKLSIKTEETVVVSRQRVHSFRLWIDR